MTCGVCLSLGVAAGLAAGSTRVRQAMCVVPSAQPPPRPGCVIAMLSSWPQGVCLVAPPSGSHQRPRRDESGERTCLVQNSWGGGGVRAAWPSPRVLGISAVLLPVAGERRRNWMPWLQLSSWLVHSSIPQIFTKCSPCVRHCDNLVRFKHERVLCFKELVPWSSGWINPEVFVFVLISPRTCRAKSYQRPSVYFPI